MWDGLDEEYVMGVLCVYVLIDYEIDVFVWEEEVLVQESVFVIEDKELELEMGDVMEFEFELEDDELEFEFEI